VRTTEAAKDVPRVKRIAGDWECRAGQISAKAYVDTAALELIGIELPVVREDGMPGRGAADKAESLAGCKSPYRQLPVFGRLAYPGRAAATTHERPGRKSPSCPAAVFAAVGTIRGASKLGGRNITKYLQPRKHALREVVRRIEAGSRPYPSMGKADDIVEETGESTRCTAGVWGPASKHRLSE